MDKAEGRRRNLREIEAVPEIPENEQNEPWGWGDKIMPERTGRALLLYREYLERLDNGD